VIHLFFQSTKPLPNGHLRPANVQHAAHGADESFCEQQLLGGRILDFRFRQQYRFRLREQQAQAGLQHRLDCGRILDEIGSTKGQCDIFAAAAQRKSRFANEHEQQWAPDAQGLYLLPQKGFAGSIAQSSEITG